MNPLLPASFTRFLPAFGVLAMFAVAHSPAARAADPAPTNAVLRVVRPAASGPVDFDRDVLPFLQGNCLPCHNRTTSKADLLLESPADMLRGGESGPALVPGKAAESLLFRMSTHEARPRMPPKDNKVNAVDLTPEQLGLLAAWIDQGAKASERRAVAIRWESTADRIRSIYGLATTPDGAWVAVGNGPRLRVLDADTGKALQELTDPALGTPAAAHRDLVNAVAFSPDGSTIASGGYREIKLWSRSNPEVTWTPGSVPASGALPKEGLVAPAGPGRVLRLASNGVPFIASTTTTNASKAETWAILPVGPRLPSEDPARLRALAQSESDASKAALESAEKESKAQDERWTKAVEALATAERARATKADALAKLRVAASIAEARIARAEGARASTNDLKALREKAAAATKAIEPADKELLAAQNKLDAAGEEHRLAGIGRSRARFQLAIARERVATARAAAAVTVPPPAPWPALRATAWSADGSRLAIATGPRVHVWATDPAVLRTLPMSSGTNVVTLPAARWIASFHPGDAVDRLAFEKDGLRMGRSGSGDSALVPVEPRWTLVRTLGTGGDDSPIADRVNALAFRPDGLRLASGSGEPTRGGEIRVWDPSSGTHVFGLTNAHSDAVLALAWSPDGLRLASGGADRMARVFDISDGRQVATLEGHTGHVLAVSWRANGRVVATGGADASVKFWTLGSADKAKTAGGLGKEVVALCHLGTDGDVVAFAGDREPVRVTESGEKPATLAAAKDFLHAAAATADGQRVLAGGQDGVTRVWDVKEKKVVRELAP
jgi:WD40 repeat protein